MFEIGKGKQNGGSIYKFDYEKWKDAFIQLMNIVDGNIPEGFEKTMQYNMISYVVPLSSYPNGYHEHRIRHYLLSV